MGTLFSFNSETRGRLIAVALTASLFAIACGGAQAGVKDAPRQPDPAPAVGAPAATHEELSSFLQHIVLIRQDRDGLRAEYRNFTGGVAQGEPIFPWASSRAVIEEIATAGDDSDQSSLIQVRATKAMAVLVTTDALSERYLELQRRVADVPTQTRRIKHVAVLYSAALSFERQAMEVWASILVYGDAKVAALLSLVGNAEQFFATADERLAVALADAGFEDPAVFHITELSQRQPIDF